MIEIIYFDDAYAQDFRRLNLAWLEKYRLTEAHDLELLDDPRGTIIDPGGCIFLAKAGDAIVGCAGLFKAAMAEYELVKMTVAEDFRGMGISKLLLTRCLEEAKRLGAHKITLLSNHQLERALQLYKQFGFKDVPVGESVFELADVKMERLLNES